MVDWTLKTKFKANNKENMDSMWNSLGDYMDTCTYQRNTLSPSTRIPWPQNDAHVSSGVFVGFYTMYVLFKI